MKTNINRWLADILTYSKSIKYSKNYRCKIIDIGLDKKQEIIIWVLINGIKKQIISYFPVELVNNDKMLLEFSPLDVRAITFYFLQQERYKNSIPSTYYICGQNLNHGQTTFLFTILGVEGVHEKTAMELYYNKKLLCQFNQLDLINIVSTAIQEQTNKDLSD